MIATRGIAPAACRGARLFCLATNSTFSPSRALPGRIYASDDGRDETVGRLESMTGSSQAETSVVENGQPQAAGKPVASQKEVNKFASTFAPRASGSTGKPNPAYKGSWLYTVFDVQAWAALVVGGLLSFNVIFPSDEPDIARLMGMWSIWMFTIPSLRARECTQREKDALNLLFLLVPLCVSLCRCVDWLPADPTLASLFVAGQTCCCRSSGRTLGSSSRATLYCSSACSSGKGTGPRRRLNELYVITST